MPRFALRIAYDGTDFAGWARQPAVSTVQESIEGALYDVLGRRERPRLSVAGRTDAGVHARGQVASFESDRVGGRLLPGLNGLLPPTIRVDGVAEVEPEFDARRSAAAKTYRYHLDWDRIGSPFLRRFWLSVPRPLHLDAMSEAARHLEGEIDMGVFAAHRARAPQADGPAFRTVYSSEFRYTDERGVFEIVGSGFLHHAVRRIVGTLLEVGKGKLSPRKVARLAREGESDSAGPTIGASGLFLWEVSYPDGLTPRFAEAPRVMPFGDL